MAAIGTLVCLFLFSAALSAQTAETAIFRAVLLPGSEVPPVNTNARGTVDILASVVRDNSGQIVSGTVDFLARVTFSAAVTATGLFINNGTSTQNGPAIFRTNRAVPRLRPGLTIAEQSGAVAGGPPAIIHR